MNARCIKGPNNRLSFPNKAITPLCPQYVNHDVTSRTKLGTKTFHATRWSYPRIPRENFSLHEITIEKWPNTLFFL